MLAVLDEDQEVGFRLSSSAGRGVANVSSITLVNASAGSAPVPAFCAFRFWIFLLILVSNPGPHKLISSSSFTVILTEQDLDSGPIIDFGITLVFRAHTYGQRSKAF